MNAREFEKLFSESTRAAVNWRHVRSKRWRVDEHVITSRSQLGKLLLPWSEDGDWNDDRRRRVTVAEAAASGAWDIDRRLGIEAAAVRFLEHRPAALVVPRVRRGRGAPVVVDGCHRLCGLWRSHLPVSVLVLTLRIPKRDGAAFDA